MSGTLVSDLSSAVAPTTHPLVAKYSLTLPPGAFMSVEFGLDATYGYRTSAVAAPPGGGLTSVLVAGMRADTQYLMRAVVQRSDGWTVTDLPQTFRTSPLPPDVNLPSLEASTTPGQTPSPGVELLNIIQPQMVSVIADLQGHILWFYDNTADAGWEGYAFPIKFLPNGHLLASISNMYTRAYVEQGPNSVLREVDLIGDTVQTGAGPRELYLADLNARLEGLETSKGTRVTAHCYSHDVLPLPNGHVMLLVEQLVLLPDAGDPAATRRVMGNALVDLDETYQPVWVWSAFDWLDVTRQPGPFKPPNPADDWTHGNAVVLTPDGNLLVSLRNQNWILKINYQRGSGDGSLMWVLGDGGTLQWSGGGDPDWFAGQHFPRILAVDGPQITSLGMFDNGNDRATTGSLYSRAAIFAIDESRLEASLTWQYLPDRFSYWGGNILQLDTGNIEFAMSEPCAVNTVPPKQDLPSIAIEVTSGEPPQIVWQLQATRGAVYRSYRIPSLYPGVNWY